jgi:general secretion pathway protein G
MRTRIVRPVADAERGFTLIEIMIVVAIIGLIMSSVGIVAVKQWRRAQVEDAKRTVHTVEAAVDLFSTQHNDPCPQGGIAGLVSERLLKKHPKDPWGQELIFTCPGTNNPEGADVVSKGPDKQEGTADDIRSWEL